MDAESATSTSHDSPIRHVSAPSPGSAAEALRAADLPAEANTKWRRAVLLQGAAATYGRNLAAAEAASFRATVAPRSSASFSGIPTIPDSAAGVSRLAAPETSVSSAAEALRAAGLEEGAAYVHPSYTRRSPSDSASSAAGVSRLAAPETSVSSAAEALRATDSGKSAAYERNPSSVKSAAELDDVAAYYDRRHYSPSRAADPPAEAAAAAERQAAAKGWESQRSWAAPAAPATPLSSTAAVVNSYDPSSPATPLSSTAVHFSRSVGAPSLVDSAAILRSEDAPVAAHFSKSEADLAEGVEDSVLQKGVSRKLPTETRNVYTLTWFADPKPWFKCSLDTSKDVSEIIKFSEIFNNAGIMAMNLHKRPENGAILTKENGISFYSYGRFKLENGLTGESWKIKGRRLKDTLIPPVDVDSPRADSLLPARRNVVSLLSKKNLTQTTIIGLCYSTCDDGDISISSAGYLKGKVGLEEKNDYEAANRLICVKTKGGLQKVKILFSPFIGNVFFSGNVLFDTTGEYIGPARTGSLLRKRDDGIFEVITGFFRGDWILKMTEQFQRDPSEGNGRFCQYVYTSTSTSTCKLVGMASGDVSWEYKLPLTKVKNTGGLEGGFNPYNTNLTFVNWNFGNSKNVLIIPQNDIYAHASKSTKVLCTAFNMDNSNRFMFVTKEGYEENNKVNNRGTLFKFRYTRGNQKFCIELILGDGKTKIENVVYFRVYKLATSVAEQRRGLLRKHVEVEKVNKNLLAIKLKSGKITDMGLYTQSAANADIGTIVDDYGKQYERIHDTWKVTDSLSNTYTQPTGDSFKMCREQKSQVDTNYISNLEGVKDCYRAFFGTSTTPGASTTLGAFDLAIEKLGYKSLSSDFADTTEHEEVYKRLIDNITTARDLTEEVLKAAWNTEQKIRTIDDKSKSWNFGDWKEEDAGEPADEGSVGRLVAPPAAAAAPASVVKPSLSYGCIAKVDDSYSNTKIAGKHFSLTTHNTDDNTWTTAGNVRIPANVLTFIVKPPEDVSVGQKRRVLIGELDKGADVDNAILTSRLEDSPVEEEAAAALTAAAASTIKPLELEHRGIAIVTSSHGGIKVGKLVYLGDTRDKDDWLVYLNPGEEPVRVPVSSLKPRLSASQTIATYDATLAKNPGSDGAAIWNLILNPPLSASFIPGAAAAPRLESPLPEGKLEKGGIARVKDNYPNDRKLRKKHVVLKRLVDENTWSTWQGVAFPPSIVNIDKKYLIPVRSGADTGGVTNIKETLDTLDREAAADAAGTVIAPATAPATAAAPPPAPVIQPPLEDGGIAMVNATYYDEKLRNKHVFLQSHKGNSWSTWQIATPNTHDIDQRFLTPILSKANTGSGIKILHEIKRLDQQWADNHELGGGRRGTRKYRGRRGNGANMRRRLTRKAKGQAGGGGRRGSGSGGRSGSKRRGGKMYRKTMKHVRRGRGGRKGRKGHRRTIKKYHRR